MSRRIDIYYDPKSLKADHAEALWGTLRNLVVAEAKRFALQTGLPLLKKLNVRRIEAVEKARGRAPDKFQTGVWVAHKLCASLVDIQTGGFSRIKYYDMTDVVRRTVQQFDGKSFYAG